MRPPTEEQAISEIIDVLADLFGTAPKKIDVHHNGADHHDWGISIAEHQFATEYRSNASTGPIAAAIDRLKCCASGRNAGTPLIIVPFMGQVGKHLCDQSGMSWLDLCGNAKIVAPGLRILVEGRPNKYVSRGRPPNVFAAKSSRIARQVLLQPGRFQTQSELARATGLGDGYVSKIVRRLKDEHYLAANDAGAVRPRDPNLLLDAWHDAYNFDRHRIIKGHVPARSGDELLRRVVDGVSRHDLGWAVTGLSAAWLYTNFAAFRLATVYLSSMPPRSLMKELDFSNEPRGANLWFVLPDDDGVFHGGEKQNGIRCVSVVQTYVDLKGHPERAKDAAAELRRKLLNWT